MLERKKRFGLELSSNNINSIPNNEEEKEKRRKRAERFGMIESAEVI